MSSRRLDMSRPQSPKKKRSSKGISFEDFPEKSILQPRLCMLDMSSGVEKYIKKKFAGGAKNF